MSKYKIGFIGGGVMAGAIVRQLLKKKIFKADQVLVSDVDNQRLDTIKNQLKINITNSKQDLVNQSEMVFLAVKPQSFPVVAKELKDVKLKNKLILSIIAGVSIGKIKNVLGTSKIVRIMPNTPAQVGCGMSVWVATGKVSKKDRILITKILRALGKEIYVNDEDLINSATAISGSGPAYLFLVMEVMCKKAINLGFDKIQAKKLVIQTVFGSSQIAKISNEDFYFLREKVTSKGGTTEAALKVLDNERFKQVFSRAIQAANKRAQELGR